MYVTMVTDLVKEGTVGANRTAVGGPDLVAHLHPILRLDAHMGATINGEMNDLRLCMRVVPSIVRFTS